jgi:two-component system, cell cycle sensor histidine kinase and response regulator CckA
MTSSGADEQLGADGNEATRNAVLLVDDDELQLKLSTIRLEDAGFRVRAVSDPNEALRLALEHPPDAVISDVLMGEIDGFGLCRRLREHPLLSSVPVVLASAHYSDPQAQELAAHVGAAALVRRTPDFEIELSALRSVLCAPPTRLPTADAEVYEQHLRTNANQISRLLGEAQDAEGRYRALFEGAKDAIAVLDGSAMILEANERWRQVLGVDPATLVGRHLLEASLHARGAASLELGAAMARGQGHVYAVPLTRLDGATVYLDFAISTARIGGRALMFAIGRDVTGRFLAAQALAVAEEKYRSLVERLPDVVMTNTEGRCTFVTSNVFGLTGFRALEVSGMALSDWRERVHPSDEQTYAEAYRRQVAAGAERTFDLEYRWRRKDDRWVWLHQRLIAVYERGGVTFSDSLLTDVTERRRLEESLRQAQKMEAIGQLTGGIAHDFNNILATILANSQFLLDALGEGDVRLQDAQEIKLAAERAAALTRQLLAFSRRQVLELRVTDLNQVVTGVERMLRRLLGEDIELTVRLCPKLGSAQVDPVQLEQVLLNLAVNARDAMPRGGELTIETSNAELEVERQTSHGSLRAGSYVLVSVSDTGTGMDEATQRHIFEPFFTTKERGKGTGLGLATSHGIVAQSGGSFSVQSEPGRGSTFGFYLPRVSTEPERELAAEPLERDGSELILLVEDDRPLRAAVQRMLVNRGYRVLSARDPQDALDLLDKHEREISLLLTDVVMPQASGPALADAVRARAPHIKVLFMSGYTDHAVLASGVLSQTQRFIQKPFSPVALGAKVREVLEPGAG